MRNGQGEPELVRLDLCARLALLRPLVVGNNALWLRSNVSHLMQRLPNCFLKNEQAEGTPIHTKGVFTPRTLERDGNGIASVLEKGGFV